MLKLVKNRVRYKRSKVVSRVYPDGLRPCALVRDIPPNLVMARGHYPFYAVGNADQIETLHPGYGPQDD